MKNTLQILLGFAFFCFVLIGVIDKSNEIIQLRAELPKLEGKLKEKNELLVRRQYELYQMENPVRLLEMLRQPEFSGLHFPDDDEVMRCPQ